MAGTESKLDSLIRSADAVVGRCAGLRVNGKVSSKRTQDYSRELIRESCRRLHRLGYYLEDISGLREKHVEALVKDWHRQGLANKTMQNQYSRLKIFCGWIGRQGIIDNSGVGVSAYLTGISPETLKVQTYTDESKSWSGNGLDLIKQFARARLEDQRLHAMLLMGVAFGLRKKEMLRIKPWKADRGHLLEIDGSVAKNGKYRAILIDAGTEYGRFQRDVLDYTKGLCKKLETLGWPGKTIKQTENSYYHLMTKLGFTKEVMGVTGHGLRAEFAENQALLMGLMPPSLGGNRNQLDRETREWIGEQVSHMLGHDDLHTLGAYYGSFRKMSKTKGIGGRIGTVIVDAEKEIVAGIYVNPQVVKASDGRYREMSEHELKEMVVTAVVEARGDEDEMLDVETFVEKFPKVFEKTTKLLVKFGLICGDSVLGFEA